MGKWNKEQWLQQFVFFFCKFIVLGQRFFLFCQKPGTCHSRQEKFKTSFQSSKRTLTNLLNFVGSMLRRVCFAFVKPANEATQATGDFAAFTFIIKNWWLRLWKSSDQTILLVTKPWHNSEKTHKSIFTMQQRPAWLENCESRRCVRTPDMNQGRTKSQRHRQPCYPPPTSR